MPPVPTNADRIRGGPSCSSNCIGVPDPGTADPLTAPNHGRGARPGIPSHTPRFSMVIPEFPRANHFLPPPLRRGVVVAQGLPREQFQRPNRRQADHRVVAVEQCDQLGDRRLIPFPGCLRNGIEALGRDWRVKSTGRARAPAEKAHHDKSPRVPHIVMIEARNGRRTLCLRQGRSGCVFQGSRWRPDHSHVGLLCSRWAISRARTSIPVAPYTSLSGTGHLWPVPVI